jgi:CheY-like chemotaxis protein
MHGGSASVTSDGPGRGSIFTVRLPWVANPPNKSATVPPTVVRTLSSPPRRVMVVDDNDHLAASLADVLQDKGHQVAVFGNAVTALDRLEDFRPDVALLDIGLPVIDGYDLAREIRARLGDATPFLVAFTGYAQPGDAQRSRDAGFDSHFVKPVNLDQLLHAIEGAPEGG